MDSSLISLSFLLLFLPQDVFLMDAAEVQTCGNDWEDFRGQRRSLTTTPPSRHWTLPIKWSFVAQEDWTESGYKGVDTNKYFGLTKVDIDRTRQAIKYIEDRTCIRFKEVQPNKDDDWMLVRRVAQAPIGASDRTPSTDFRCLFRGEANKLGAFNEPAPSKSDWIRYKLYRIYKAINNEYYPWSKCFRGATATTGTGQPAFLSLHLVTPNLALMVHELLHIIGLQHTQHRRDAKNHIEVLWQNIEERGLRAYRPFNDTRYYYNDYNIPYDCSSIMHYAPSFFSKNGQPTMIAKHPEKCKLKYNKDMSEYDKQFVQEMYKKQCSVTQGNYIQTGSGSLCPSSQPNILTVAECRAAASLLGLTWENAWDGPGDHPGCLLARNKVYFNTSPFASTTASPTYASICVRGNYIQTGSGSLCPSSQPSIQTVAECRAAASLLGLTWETAWDGPGDHPGCLLARNKVYFNTSPFASTTASPTYASICVRGNYIQTGS